MVYKSLGIKKGFLISFTFVFIAFFLFPTIFTESAVLVYAEGSWIQAKELNEDADEYLPVLPASSLLPNGNVLVIGTDVGFYNIYNPVADDWTIQDNFDVVTTNIGLTSHRLFNDKILVVGFNSFDPITQKEISGQVFDPTDNGWTKTGAAVLPIRIGHAANLLSDGKVLVSGGYGGFQSSDSNLFSDAEIYNPATNTWTATGNMKVAKNYHTSTLLKNGNVLVTGGGKNTYFSGLGVDYQGADTIDTSEIFDPMTGIWSFTSPMQQARSGHSATLLPSGKVLVVGGELQEIVNGEGFHDVLASAELYDTNSGEWTSTGSMAFNRIWHTATLLPNGKVLVVGGLNGVRGYEDNLKAYNTAELYDPVSGTWTTISAPMNDGRAFHTTSQLQDGKVFVAGGINYVKDDEDNCCYYSTLNTAEIFNIGEVLGEETGPGAFLELPFEYKSKGKSFDQMAYNPSSWFDHKYPLQNINCCTFKVTKFNYNGRDADDAYRSHSGYDYASYNGVVRHTPVLAAAAGIAIFVPESKSGGAGNTIKIDHGNGYQTWYEHLELSDLVVSLENVSANVQKGQMIGRVGMSGNTNGPHIHFSLIKDANNNGNFNDDYPFGLVDPLGWEGKNDAGNEIIDPWTQYSVGGKNGEKSYSLFIDKDKPVKASIPASGGSLELKSININAPGGVYPTFFTISANTSSYEKQDNLLSAMPSFYLYAFDNLGQSITQFLSPIQILYDYAAADLLNIKESTLKLYYFNTETGRWEALPSSVDTENKKVTASTTHFSHFALMGERIDDVSPTTTAEVQGVKGQDYWYRSSVKVTLNSQDNNDGVGLQYTLYSINDGDWLEYVEPITLNNEGEHTLTYQSFDKADNKSDRKVLAINIDKTAPEGEIVYDISKYDMVVKGKDDTGPATVKVDNTSRLNPKYIVSDKAGNTLTINTSELQIGKQVTQTIKSLQYNSANAIHLDRNIFFTLVLSDRNNALKQLDQYFSLAGDKKIFTKYTSSTDKTKIYTKSTGSQYTLELKNGLVLLNLYTAKGILKYQY